MDHAATHPSVRIVHGDIGSGKTHRVKDWAQSEADGGRLVGGILARKTAQGREFLDLMSGDTVALENPGDGEASVEVGRYRFRQAAFDWAIGRVDAAVQSGVAAIVIDEVGPLEMRGEGFAHLLDRLEADAPGIERVLLVRTGLVEAVIDRFAKGARLTFDPPKEAV